MPALNNSRHEQFAQNVASGLSLTAAYVAAGYKKAGASANAARLIRDGTISARVHELQNEIAAKLSQMREERISSLQQRIDGYNERRQKLLAIIGERAMAGWNAPGASTGLLTRVVKSIGSGKNFKEIEEFRVDTALLRELREVEKQAAIELSQWTEKRDVKMDANVTANAKILAATFTLGELERMMSAGLQVVEQRLQQQQPATAAALSSGEDGGIPVTAEVVDEGRPKQDEPADPDTKPHIPEWMR
jgi:Terminase small subunit